MPQRPTASDVTSASTTDPNTPLATPVAKSAPLATVPLSVWLAGQQPSRLQRAGRYVPASMAHPGKMLPAIAAQAIADYTHPGDLVLDPMCGIGTTLVEAVHAGRDAVGVEYEPAWAQLARRNLHHARSHGATGTGRVIDGDARHLDTLLDPQLRGRVALVLTSPPYGASLHGQVTAVPGKGVVKSDDRYSRDPANLAHVGLDRLLEAMVEIVTGCAPFLKSGGILAMTVRPYWEKGTLVDLPGRLTTAISEHTVLRLLDRNVVLLAALRADKGGERLVTRASFFQLNQVRKARAAGIPRHLIAHEDLLVWRHEATAEQAASVRETPRGWRRESARRRVTVRAGSGAHEPRR